MTATALYTHLSGYYDQMCAQIDYHSQCESVMRLHGLFGNGGTGHLDLACGTGPHVRHFLDAGYQSAGLDINEPMLVQARARCPEAQFSAGDMCAFELEAQVDLITCFLYSIHYTNDQERLGECIACVHKSLNPGGVFCFDAVDKSKIRNVSLVSHELNLDQSRITFRSGWRYRGEGEQMSLQVDIEKVSESDTEAWHDEHSMVAISFSGLRAMLAPLFDVHILEHDYNKIVPWDKTSGNAIFVCIKR